MASIRLNAEHRHFLDGLAMTSLQCPAEERTMVAAYDKLRPLVIKMIEERFPPKDMAILAKYDKAMGEWEARVNLTAGGVEQVALSGVPYLMASVQEQVRAGSERTVATAREKGVPLVPTTNYSSHLYAADDKITNAFGAYQKAHTAWAKALNAKRSDYAALIRSSATLEQVEEVWPEAGVQLRKRINAALPVVLSDEVMARIRADAKQRKSVANVEVSQDFQRTSARKVKTTIEMVDEEFVGNP